MIIGALHNAANNLLSQAAVLSDPQEVVRVRTAARMLKDLAKDIEKERKEKGVS